MAEALVVAQSGEKSGSLELPERIFGITPHLGALHEAVRVHLSNRRQGTSKVKGRSEVNATGRKPWRQKGTGRARAGSFASPIWRGGGIVFGPQPRSYRRRMPRKLRRLAVRSALSARASEGAVLILETLDLPEVKTRRMVELLRNLELAEHKSLFVLPAYDEGVCRATGNLPRVEVRVARELNAYDVLNCERVVLLKGALPVLEEVYR